MISRTFITLLAVLYLSAVGTSADRHDLRLPVLPDYQIILCDLHSHTVFSDGEVWPSLRVREAFQNGLEALAITDHIEYQPHEKDLPTNLNRSVQIAAWSAKNYMITLIKGAEITRDMPPGHFNALFLNDVNPLKTDEWRDAIKAAADQGAFIFWNHPGWRGQQPDGIAKWYDEQTEILAKGWMHGIEVVNEDEYYPEAHQWCLDKGLTLLGNSDIHGTIAEQYERTPAKHRPMTWVLAKENSEQAIKEALFAHRTVVYWRDWLIGEKPLLAEIFYNSIKLPRPSVQLSSADGAPLKLVNTSDLTFELAHGAIDAGLEIPESVTLPPSSTIILPIQKKKGATLPQMVTLSFVVANFKTAPNQGLPIEWKIAVE
jgi:3',5'-nucleoside bisphosphate phosphatase